MRIVSLWRALRLRLMVAGAWRARGGSSAGAAAPEFTALDADFFARGAALEEGVVAGTDEYDTQPF